MSMIGGINKLVRKSKEGKINFRINENLQTRIMFILFNGRHIFEDGGFI